MTPENAALLAEYELHFERSPLTATARAYLGAVCGYLASLSDATAKD